MTRNIAFAIATSSFLTLSSCTLFQDTTKVTTVATPTENTATAQKEHNSSDKKAPKQTNKKRGGKKFYQKAATTPLPQSQPTGNAISAEALNGEWTIAEVNGETIKGEERPYIYFEVEQGRIYGSNGCNTINADFALDGNKLTLSNVLSTQKACHDAPYEYQINIAISQVATNTVEQKGNEYYMSLFDANGTKILVLRKHNMDYLNGHWQIVSINGEKCSDNNAQLVIDIPELKLHGNTGCNTVNGKLLIDPDKKNSIQFHQLISTRMACPNQSQETAILVALEEVESAKTDKEENYVTMFNKNGKEILRIKKL